MSQYSVTYGHIFLYKKTFHIEAVPMDEYQNGQHAILNILVIGVLNRWKIN